MEGRLTERDRAAIANLYNDRFNTLGRDVRTVGWGSMTDQVLRFKILFRGLDFTGKTILDLGCGLGDLVGFIHAETSGNFRYIGVDLSANLVEDARLKWKDYNATFHIGDVFDLPESIRPDISVQSGALSLKIADNESYARQVTKKLFDITHETVAMNFLSSYVDFVTEKNYHYKPEEFFSFAKTLTKWVNLFHDYPLWEFTIQLHKTAKI